MDASALARGYYDAIDEGEYDRLQELLTPEFSQVRADRTFEDREAFVRFMREERPEPETTHEIEHVTVDGDRVVVEGILRRPDGTAWFHFADAFTVSEGRLQSLRTYTLSATA